MKNRTPYLLLFSLVVALFSACQTDDVRLEEDGPVPMENLVEVTDEALGEYLVYNRIDGAVKVLSEDSRSLTGHKFYIDTVKAKNVAAINVVKNTSAIQKLEQAGLVTAAIKIKNFDVIQYFVNVSKLQITSNEIGALDLRRLTKLDTLEMNYNYLGSIDLTKNVNLTRIRFQGSTNDVPEVRRISTIDLSSCPKIEHIYLVDQDIKTIKLPEGKSIKLLDLSNTPGPDGDRSTPDVVIPAATFNNIVANKGTMMGVKSDEDVVVPSTAYQLSDAAFGEYLTYLVGNGDLPAGAAYYEAGQYFIKKDIVKSVESLLLPKTSKDIEALAAAGLATASTKIASVDGLQFFTSLKVLRLTSNSIKAIDLSALTNLENIDINNNAVAILDVSKNVKLTKLSYNASSKAADGEKITSIDLTMLSELTDLSLRYNGLTAIDVSKNTKLTSIELRNNPGSDFTIPAAIFDNLTTANGVKK